MFTGSKFTIWLNNWSFFKTQTIVQDYWSLWFLDRISFMPSATILNAHFLSDLLRSNFSLNQQKTTKLSTTAIFNTFRKNTAKNIQQSFQQNNCISILEMILISSKCLTTSLKSIWSESADGAVEFVSNSLCYLLGCCVGIYQFMHGSSCGCSEFPPAFSVWQLWTRD